MRVLRLALADLLHDRVHLACLVAMIAGVVVPLSILLGVKTGVFAALIDDLRNQPGILQVTLPGDRIFTEADVAAVAAWPETGFVAPDIRAITRRLDVARPGGDRIRRAALVPTAEGDPLTPAGGDVPTGLEVTASAALAEAIGLAAGDALIGLARRGDPATEALRLEMTVTGVLDRPALAGEALLMDPATMELIEAFYDGYALPEFGVSAGRDLAGRSVGYESLRIYARDLVEVAPLEALLRGHFDIPARSRAAEVAATLRLGRNLDLALALVAGAAILGLAAALLSSFWATVQRKRQTLAMLGLVGLTPGERALFPVLQAVIAGAAGVVASFLLLLAAAGLARWLFADQLPGGAAVITLRPGQIAWIAGGTLALSVVSAYLAARAAARIDPAETLRGG